MNKLQASLSLMDNRELQQQCSSSQQSGMINILRWGFGIAENYLFRDELKKLLDTCKKLEDKITQVLRDIEDILFVDKSKSIARLLPSFYDRRPFTNILTLESESSEASNNSGNISYQILAKQFFSKRIQDEVAAQKVQTNSNLRRPLILFLQIFQRLSIRKLCSHFTLISYISSWIWWASHSVRWWMRSICHRYYSNVLMEISSMSAW